MAASFSLYSRTRSLSRTSKRASLVVPREGSCFGASAARKAIHAARRPARTGCSARQVLEKEKQRCAKGSHQSKAERLG